jgi:NhaC family Na+:H+ antiporter
MTTTKVQYKRLIPSMLYTFLPVYTISALLYYLIGRVYTTNTALSHFLQYQQAIFDSFYVSPWLLLLPLGVVCLSVMGVKVIQTISIGLVGGILLSGWLQKMAAVEILHAIVYGYRGATTSPELNRILISGGIRSMIEVLFIVIGAISLSSMLERTGLIQPLVNKVTARVKSKGELVLKTGVISSLLTIVTCDQTVGIILPSRLLREKYEQLGLGQELLARTISDTGTIIAPLFPWNVNALIIGVITGISAMEYAPYAVLCYIFPLISILLSYSWQGNTKQGYNSAR